MGAWLLPKLIVGLVHIGASWLLVALSVPFIQYKIKPNPYWASFERARWLQRLTYGIPLTPMRVG
jgi:hypothetical protein